MPMDPLCRYLVLDASICPHAECKPRCTCPTDTDIDAALAAANDRLHKGETNV